MMRWGGVNGVRLASNLNFPPPIRIFQRHHGSTSGADLDLDMAFEDDDCQFHVSEDIQVSRCFKLALHLIPSVLNKLPLTVCRVGLQGAGTAHPGLQHALSDVDHGGKDFFLILKYTAGIGGSDGRN